jgi:hypothetical protein
LIWASGEDASEVKSHSSIDRFLVVFHSPTGMAKTGLLACRSEKKAERRGVTDAVTREHLEVEQFFMMHIGPTPWSDLNKAVQAAEAQDTPTGLLP